MQGTVTTLVWFKEEKRRVRATVNYVNRSGRVVIDGKVYNCTYNGVWKTTGEVKLVK